MIGYKLKQNDLDQRSNKLNRLCYLWDGVYIFGAEALLVVFLIKSLKLLTVSAFKKLYFAPLILLLNFSNQKEVVEIPEWTK